MGKMIPCLMDSSSLTPSSLPFPLIFIRKPTGNSAASTAIAARGLSDLVCRPPVALVGDDEVATVIDSLTAVVLAPEALRDDGIAGGSGGEFALWETGGGGLGGVGDGGKEPAASGRRNTASFSALLGLR